MEFNAIQLSCDIYLSSKFVISLSYHLFFVFLIFIHMICERTQKKRGGGSGG